MKKVVFLSKFCEKWVGALGKVLITPEHLKLQTWALLNFVSFQLAAQIGF